LVLSFFLSSLPSFPTSFPPSFLPFFLQYQGLNSGPCTC
jgi:hypothetical protein